MFVQALRKSRWMMMLLFVARVYLGWAWLTAGWHKIVDGFDASGYLKGAVGKAAGEHPAVQGWWADFWTGLPFRMSAV